MMSARSERRGVSLSLCLGGLLALLIPGIASAAPDLRGIVPASELVPGAEVYDDHGSLIGRIESINGPLLSVSTAGQSFQVPVSALRKIAGKLVIATSQAQIDVLQSFIKQTWGKHAR